jgi:hypothetical protein
MHGSPDISLVYEDKYRILAEQYARMYAELGLELITARTNLMQFSAHRIPFVSFLEAPTVSCALALSPMLSGLLTPAGETYRRYSLITTGPMTAQHFTTESFESKESGAAYLRLQKVEMISQWEPVLKNLRVCFGFASKEKTTNCSRCSKCMRTRLDLNILGRLHMMETFDRNFTFLDYLRWGRWLEIGHGWEKNAWNYCRKHRPSLLPILLVGIVTGYIRAYLKRCLPHGIKKWIYKFTSGNDPHIKHEAGQPVVHKAEIDVQES